MATGRPIDETVDLVVVGSGAGGLSAAVAAGVLGLSVIVLEKASAFGGTTAWSGGWMWIPRNAFARDAGFIEDIGTPRRYLENETGSAFDAARVDTYLTHAPRMVDFFRARTSVEFIAGNNIPDFHIESPGAVSGGRSVGTAPFDGRELGSRLKKLRPPLELFSIRGMGIASGMELQHFFDALHRWQSFWYVARRMAALAMDLFVHGRSMRLVNGNALVGRLAKSALDCGVEIRTESPAVRLMKEKGRVAGVVFRHAGVDHAVRARRGVVLACGGFPHDVARIQQLFRHAPTGQEHHSAAPLENSGDGLRLAESVGGVVDDRLLAPGAWAPVSLVPRSDGSIINCPHMIERAKPGLIAVTRSGCRFVNEASTYYDFMEALFAATPPGSPVEAWLICDHRFIRRYGLGAVRPAPFRIRPWLRLGYLLHAATPAKLARACGLDVPAFLDTLNRYNDDARYGTDRAFGRGNAPINLLHGDPNHRPNPCVAPIERSPYYAVKIVPGSLGTFAGLRTDSFARVLDNEHTAIPGLYACGNDMASIMGGRYPSGGITLGPAMTFGYIAAHHAAGQALP